MSWIACVCVCVFGGGGLVRRRQMEGEQEHHAGRVAALGGEGGTVA